MQTRIASKQLFAAAVHVVFLGALFGTSAAYAQQTANTPKSVPAAAATGVKPSTSAGLAAKRSESSEPTAKPGEPEGEGVKIHGYWVIDVRNPDGKLVEHREFENSLATVAGLPSGDQLLAGLLSGNLTAGDPGIGLVQGTPGTDPSTYCNTSLAAQFGGSLTPNATCFGLTTASSGMTSYLVNFTTGLTSTVTFSPAVKWVLSGTYTAPAALTSISAVQTLVATCFKPDPSFVKQSDLFGGHPTATTILQFAGTTSLSRSGDFPSAGCAESQSPPSNSYARSVTTGGTLTDYLDFATFTSTKLATPLALSAGQIIMVTVTISFS